MNPKQANILKYRVMVDDNFHYMDEDERHCAGEFPTYEAALACAIRIVEESVAACSGTTAEEIVTSYQAFGDDPFIVCLPGTEAPQEPFSAWKYAEIVATELSCGGSQKCFLEKARPEWLFR